jgi:hypothetical protein
MKTWRCGDCGREIPKSETTCGRTLDDYLSLRGGSIESAIAGAVSRAIEPLVAAAEERLTRSREWKTMTNYRWRWTR